MAIQFYKYHGAGNDFVILDNRKNEYDFLTEQQVKKICNRHFGIGADGLMLLNEKSGYDFEMIYFNADGQPGSFCGNGSRCIVQFAFDSGIEKEEYFFAASDGNHEAKMKADGTISVKMKDVDTIHRHHGDYILNTGSPHYIKIITDLRHLDVIKKGRDIRYHDDFKKEGINVNFVENQTEPDKIKVRTYERGVEDETLSCGTGVTAAALVCFHNDNGFNEVEVTTIGGMLNVEFDRSSDGKYSNIWLYGPAEKVFEGVIPI